jgi:predicted ester cyclase
MNGETIPKKTEGANAELVRQMFLAGESMHVENFVKFYNDDALYQFSNFPVAYGPQGIINASQAFLATVAEVKHHIVNLWEIDHENLVCEMTVSYKRHDGKSFTLPCCDTIQIKNGNVQALRIYMDITPVFADNTAQANKELMHRYHTLIWEQKKTELIPEYLSPKFTSHSFPPDAPTSVEAIQNFVSYFFAAFPDMTSRENVLMAEGDKVAISWTINGTHQGEFLGVAPTGRKISATGLDIMRIEDGKFVEHWGGFYDQMPKILGQLTGK